MQPNQPARNADAQNIDERGYVLRRTALVDRARRARVQSHPASLPAAASSSPGRAAFNAASSARRNIVLRTSMVKARTSCAVHRAVLARAGASLLRTSHEPEPVNAGQRNRKSGACFGRVWPCVAAAAAATVTASRCLLFGLVLERDPQLRAVGECAVFVDVDVLLDDLGNPEVAKRLSGHS